VASDEQALRYVRSTRRTFRGRTSNCINLRGSFWHEAPITVNFPA